MCIYYFWKENILQTVFCFFKYENITERSWMSVNTHQSSFEMFQWNGKQLTSPVRGRVNKTRPAERPAQPTCTPTSVQLRHKRISQTQASSLSHYSSSHRTSHESSFRAIRTETKNESEATQWLQWVSACNVICQSLCSLSDMITGRASAGRVKRDGGLW